MSLTPGTRVGAYAIKVLPAALSRDGIAVLTAARQGFGNSAKTSKGVGAMSKKQMGSGIDDFLKEKGIFEKAQAQAVKEVVAWQLAEAMKKKKISKNRMATLLKTSRTQVDRLLDPKNDITLGSLQRAAEIVGRRLTIGLV
ncbi:MAG: Fis family transcriptional regulator [Bryobacteraceae bacterium]